MWMMRFIFNLLSFLSANIAIWYFIADWMNNAPSSAILGQVWFMTAPSSLQIAEAVVERYIDPCSVMLFLGCSPFLWHPGIATILQWPVANVFAGSAVGFFILAQFSTKRGRRKNTRLYKDH